MEPEPQDPPVPQPAPNKQDLPPPKSDPLLDSILLPKKDAPTGSARRVDASILLEQETTAGREGMVGTTPRPPTPPLVPTEVSTLSKESTTPKVQTFQGDLQNIVQSGGATVVSIATAEAQRRAKTGQSLQEEPAPGAQWGRYAMIAGGVILMLAAVAAVVYVTTRETRVPTPADIPAPFITVDETELLPLSLSANSENTMSTLVSKKNAVAISLGLVGRILPTVASTSEKAPVQEMDAQTFLSLLAPDVPLGLVRTLAPRFLFGVHSFAQNQPFLIFGIDTYEQAFSQMIVWEDTLQEDLAPLFTITPLTRINPPTTGTTTVPTQLLQTPFIDEVVENHDARVLKNNVGDILLLWTFLDRQTLVIATNGTTLREIISRLQTSSL